MKPLADDEVGVVPVLIANVLKPAVMLRTSEDELLLSAPQARALAQLLQRCAAEAEAKAERAKVDSLVAVEPMGRA